MSQYGLTDWSQVELKGNNNGGQNNKDLYLRLQNGNNVVRVVTKPHEYLVHRYKAHEDDPGYGDRIMSSIHHGSDPLIEMGQKPKRRWLVGVIDRVSQSYKILDMSVSVFKGLQELVRDEDWGDPTQFDVDIKVDKQGGPTGYYTIIPKSKKPLSAADLDIKSQIDLEDLKRRCTPPTPDQVAAKVKVAQEKSPNFSGQPIQAQPQTQAQPQAQQVVDAGSGDFPASDF
jgi:hypothetical protein